MARLRKFSAYQTIERPYTRVSKYKALSYVRAKPQLVIARFDHGHQLGNFDVTLHLLAGRWMQIRHNSLEAARQTCNRVLEKLGKTAYFMRLKKYPFHVLRENPLATGAGADRLSTGMKMSFGKPVGVAAQIKRGETLCEIFCEEKDLPTVKLGISKFRYKVPMSYSIVVIKLR